MNDRETEREKQRNRERETEKQRERKRETEREKQRERETEREKQRDRERHIFSLSFQYRTSPSSIRYSLRLLKFFAS